MSNDRAIEEFAQRFHETYERLAPDYGWKTTPASAVAWEDVPGANKALMVATVGEVLAGAGLQITDLTADTARWLVAELEGTVEAHRHVVETEPELDNPQSRALVAGLAELRRISGGSE